MNQSQGKERQGTTHERQAELLPGLKGDDTREHPKLQQESSPAVGPSHTRQ
jgi:hypothetical protein